MEMHGVFFNIISLCPSVLSVPQWLNKISPPLQNMKPETRAPRHLLFTVSRLTFPLHFPNYAPASLCEAKLYLTKNFSIIIGL